MTTIAAAEPERPPAYATAEDLKRLRAYAASRRTRGPGANILKEEVERMELPAQDGPRFVRLDSVVTYKDLRTKRRRIVQVVAPAAAEQDENRVSVTSPIGAALIGLPEGSVFRWRERQGALRAVKVLLVED